jgi:hypothetical protein
MLNPKTRARKGPNSHSSMLTSSMLKTVLGPGFWQLGMLTRFAAAGTTPAPRRGEDRSPEMPLDRIDR